jgi:hypothetical protein
MPCLISDLLFEDSKLLLDGPFLARSEGIKIRSANETKRPIVTEVSQDRKTTLRPKESTRVAVERTNQVIPRARLAIIIFFSSGQHVITVSVFGSILQNFLPGISM